MLQGATAVDAVLVFYEAEDSFMSRGGEADGGSRDASRDGITNVGILQQNIESFSGVVTVISNMNDSIDMAFFRRF